MQGRRFFFAMTGLLLVSVSLVLGGVFAGNMLFQAQARKLNELKIQNKIIEEQERSLTQAKRDIEKYQELDEISRAIVPQDKDQAGTVREITTIAAESGIVLNAISFPASSLGQKSAAAPTQPSSDEGEGSSSKPKTPPITQAQPVSGIPDVYALEIVISTPENRPVPYNKFLSFLERLESNRRTAHVDKISIKPSTGGDGLSFILTLNAYVKPPK